MAQNIMIVCGEASGDLHGSNLVKSLIARNQDLNFCGMGGPELESAGVDILYDAEKVAVVGVFEVFSHIKDILRAQKILRKKIRENPPDLLILIDLPDFNLLLAKYAKRLKIPVYYYICPQVWAWRTGRVKTMKKRVDALGVILPFEQEFFLSRNVPAKYVGHPLLDSVEVNKSTANFKSSNQIEQDALCIGLLPGSRRKEVLSLLPIFLQAAVNLTEKTNEKLVFLIPKASTISMKDLTAAGINRYENNLVLKVIKDDRYNLMAACDCVVAASGTVTLELAILQVPMVVTYKLSPLTYYLGRLLVKLDMFSLPNLIAGYRAVPELLQNEVTAERISHEMALLLNVYSCKKEMRDGLRRVKAALGDPGASARVADMVCELLSYSTNNGKNGRKRT